MQDTIRQIAATLGLHLLQAIPVGGGDINDAWCLLCDNNNYFLKLNSNLRYPGMFEAEANGLQALRSQGGLFVPEVIQSGILNDHQFLLLDWLNKGEPMPDFWEDFGRGLAMLHLQEQSQFGWSADNYIGSLPQVNTPKETWGEFYAQCRIMPLVRQLANAGKFSKTEISFATQCCKRFDELFPAEPPSLLHGDLWSGNFIVAAGGYAAIYDPAVYCGHREMDLGMTLLFGGFDKKFYDAYQQYFPLEPGWRKRVHLTQLYPLLVHAILFSGGYVQQCRSILQEFA